MGAFHFYNNQASVELDVMANYTIWGLQLSAKITKKCCKTMIPRMKDVSLF